MNIAERVRIVIAAEPVETEAGRVEVTVSLGVATYEGDKTSDLQNLIAAADQALYRAKRKGKNRVELNSRQ